MLVLWFCFILQGMQEIVSKSFQETTETGRKLASQLTSGRTICLFGNLGAGKTTFTQGFASFFGVKRIISPTFVLQRSYEIKDSFIKYLHHIDLYRLAKKEEITSLGLSDFWHRKDTITIIEWPEKILDILPQDRIKITFEFLDEQTRKIVIKNG